MSTFLPPLSIASITIGFISFTLTLLIWLNSFWQAFLTIGGAPSQVQDQLSTLRQSLYEEREHLKYIRRRKVNPFLNLKKAITSNHNDKKGSGEKSHGIYYDGGPLRVVNDAVKDLIRDFKILEAPFLMPLREGREKELEWSYDATQQYYRCDIWHRILWLRVKNRVERIAERLQQLQTRRIAAEVTECHLMLNDVVRESREYGDRLWAIEDRLRMSYKG